jgi:sporulation protein YlmC with PRC-barrel domain
MRLSELLGTPVTTESGSRLGYVRDVRAEVHPRHVAITGLVVGKLAALERLGIGAPTTTVRIRTRDVIPWEHVVRADRRGIVVRDGELRS